MVADFTTFWLPSASGDGDARMPLPAGALPASALTQANWAVAVPPCVQSGLIRHQGDEQVHH